MKKTDESLAWIHFLSFALTPSVISLIQIFAPKKRACQIVDKLFTLQIFYQNLIVS
jgi:hypothetical protein